MRCQEYWQLQENLIGSGFGTLNPAPNVRLKCCSPNSDALCGWPEQYASGRTAAGLKAPVQDVSLAEGCKLLNFAECQVWL
ncbi:hypothetical protein RA26_13905 [Leisingera sp. ANG-M7]|nr:hypothetical protein RA26_13905 [Leisingera sp. ANG-M7]